MEELSHITEGMTGAEAAEVVYNNDLQSRGEMARIDGVKSDISVGKNLLNPAKINAGHYVAPGGTVQEYGGTDVSPKMYFNGNRYLTCDSCETGGTINYIGVYKADDTLISCFANGVKVKTVDLNSYADAAYVIFTLAQVADRQIEYGNAKTSYHPYSPIGGYVEDLTEDVDRMVVTLNTKVDWALGANLLNPDLVTWGKAVIGGNGAIGDADAGYGVSAKIYFNGHTALISSAIARACGSGYWLVYYRADDTVISGIRPADGIVPAIEGAAYVITTVNRTYEDYSFKVEYADAITPVVAAPYNQFGKYVDPIELFAYADGDATPDVDNKFYGNKGYWRAWFNAGSGVTYYTKADVITPGVTITYASTLNHGQRNEIVSYYHAVNGISFDGVVYYVRDNTKDLNVGAIQRALFSCQPGRPYIINCVGHFKFTSVSQFAGNRGALYAMVWMQNKNVTLQGEGVNKTIIEVDLPGNLGPDFPYFEYSPVEFSDGTINDLSIVGHNCRYAVHCVSAITVKINRVSMWHKTNTDDAAIAWGSQCTFGIGAGDDTQIQLVDCEVIDDGYPLYIHDNNGQKRPYHYLIQDTRLYCKATTPGVLPLIVTLFNLNASAPGILELKNVSLGNRRVIRTGHDPAASFVNLSPDIYTRVIGDVRVPIHYDYVVGIGSVLKITSATTGATSTVRIDHASTAFETLIKGNAVTNFDTPAGVVYAENYRYFDGAPNLSGWCCGELTLDPGTANSIQLRLGDCSANTKTLIVVIDGVVKTVTFNQNYTGYSDASMLAVINTALAGAGTAELYVLGNEYYPELNQIVENLPNNSASTILRGMGVKIADGAVSAATTSAAVNGVALDDIKIGYIGRVTTKAYLPTTEKRFKIKLAVQDVCNAGDKFKISATPGVFEKDNAAGIFTADYASLVKIDL